MKKKYFGRYPFLNIFLSKLIFWTLEYRKKKLLKKNSNLSKIKFKIHNTEETRLQFNKYLNEGFKKISIGGGAKNLTGFLNIDFTQHPTVHNELVANILDLSFIPDSCIEQIHSNHVIEHLTNSQFNKQLHQYSRILMQNGILSIRCPNALGVAYGFFFGQTPEIDRESFIKLGFPMEEDFYNPLDGWYHQDLYGFYHWIWADSGNIENEHLNQLTPTKLKKAIENSGFEIIKMTEPETSNIVLMARKV